MCDIDSQTKNVFGFKGYRSHAHDPRRYMSFCVRGKVLLGILGGGGPLSSPNPDPISDQNMQFSTPVFRPGF